MRGSRDKPCPVKNRPRPSHLDLGPTIPIISSPSRTVSPFSTNRVPPFHSSPQTPFLIELHHLVRSSPFWLSASRFPSRAQFQLAPDPVPPFTSSPAPFLLILPPQSWSCPLQTRLHPFWLNPFHPNVATLFPPDQLPPSILGPAPLWLSPTPPGHGPASHSNGLRRSPGKGLPSNLAQLVLPRKFW